MTDKRAGEDDKKRHFRGGRFSISNGKHYFTTREGSLEGPFDSQAEAERELAVYIRRMSGADIYGAQRRE